ncbi:MAG: WD40 repeat domain-containing protein [Campylobacterota bacterium]|nr:WD40 repeat domain-containing protein [Campylobacterota bacterium]
MIYKLLLITTLISSLYSAKINEPTATFETSGFVTDLVYKDGKLYTATDASCVDIFDIKTKKLVKKITVSQIKDFMDDIIDSKIYSVDIFENKIMILSQAKKGARRVHIYENNKLELIIPYTEKLFIGKAKFINEDTILLGLLGSDIISYDIKKKKQNWITQVSQSKFSNFVLNEDKTEVVVADESGDLKIHNIKDGSFIKMLDGQNLDNVFQVDTKKGIIATAGQDRRIVIYNTNLNSSYYKTAKFLIYSVGLSPSAKIVAYSSDEENNVKVFKTSTKSDVGTFGGNKGTLTNILFINEKEFFVSSESTTINFYKIK